MVLNEPNYKNAIDHINETLDKGGLPNQTKWDLIFLKAGLRAEEQMAYQLRSFFGDTEAIHVFNNFKFEYNKQTVQIDHLLFNKRGFFVIESKSISGAIEVNEFSEWFRIYGKKRTPIKSPVEQVNRQSELFHKYLKANVTHICGKVVGLQKGIGAYLSQQYVSVSERGDIRGDGRGHFKDTVVKFDQIARKILDYHRETSGLVKKIFSLNPDDLDHLSSKELNQLGEFLKSTNLAVEPVAEVQRMLGTYPEELTTETLVIVEEPELPKNIPVVKQSTATSSKSCKHCNSTTVEINYGKFGYYFKCKDCDGNTAIKEQCSKCGEKSRIRKQKNEFFVYCKPCEIEDQYFVNT